MSVNIFDVSSYGEVRLNNLANKSNYKQPPPNQSVSYVQLDDDSMAFGDTKKKSMARGSLGNQVIPEENGDNTSQMTGNFDISQDQKVNGSHYMNEGLGSPSQGNNHKQVGHYTQMM